MLLLSYPLTERTPLYGQMGRLDFKKCQDMSLGHSCNTMSFSFPNHAGTHIDAPLHFCQSGQSLSDVAAEFWFSHHVLCARLSTPALPGSVIEADPKTVLSDELLDISQIEVVFLRTGFGSNRSQENYWKEAPVIAPQWAQYLRDRFPKIRFFGVDLISVSSLVHRDLGRTTHRSFLDHDRPIWLIEDLNLSLLPEGGLKNVLISPLFVEGADGSPCTVWGNLLL